MYIYIYIWDSLFLKGPFFLKIWRFPRWVKKTGFGFVEYCCHGDQPSSPLTGPVQPHSSRLRSAKVGKSVFVFLSPVGGVLEPILVRKLQFCD